MKTAQLDKIIQYPGIAIRVKADRTGCLLTCNGHTETPISRKFAADVLRGIKVKLASKAKVTA